MTKLKLLLCTLITLILVGCGPTNYQILKEEADKGNPDKQFELAMKYYKRKPDIEKKEFYLKKAADQGHTKAKYRLGTLYTEKKDCKNGNKYLIEAANDGLSEAQVDIGVDYYSGKGCLEKDIKKAKDWILKAVKQDNVLAAYNLGQIYMEENNYKQAKEFYNIVVNYDLKKMNLNYKTLSYFKIADVELKMGNKVEACSWFILGAIFNIYPNHFGYIDYFRSFDKLISELNEAELKTAFSKAIEYQFKTFTIYAFGFAKEPNTYRNTYFLRGETLNKVEFGLSMKVFSERMGLNKFKEKKTRNETVSYGLNALLYASKKLRYSSMNGYYKKCLKYLKEADECFVTLTGKTEDKLKEIVKIQIKAVEGLSKAQQEIIDEYTNKAQF